jgi:Fe2+ transport system protein FeoA
VFVTESKVVTAAQMITGQVGEVVDIEGGHMLHSRLEALGVRTGKRIRKVSAGFMRGPSVFEVDGCNIAIGFGMTTHILIVTR